MTDQPTDDDGHLVLSDTGALALLSILQKTKRNPVNMLTDREMEWCDEFTRAIGEGLKRKTECQQPN